MDINFFEPIRKNKKKTNFAGLMVFALVTSVLILLILFYASKKMKYISLEKELDEINTTMDDPNFQKQLGSVSKKEEELNDISEKYEYLLTLSSGIQGYHTVREKVIKTLAKGSTKSLYLNVVTITGNQLTMEGYATSVPDIAQFEYNLNHSGLFENIVVNTLKEELATYVFLGTKIEEVIYDYKFDVKLTISDVNVSKEDS